MPDFMNGMAHIAENSEDAEIVKAAGNCAAGNCSFVINANLNPNRSYLMPHYCKWLFI